MIVDSCHLVSSLQQAVDQGGTDESGSAGDEGAHYQLSPVQRWICGRRQPWSEAESAMIPRRDPAVRAWAVQTATRWYGSFGLAEIGVPIWRNVRLACGIKGAAIWNTCIWPRAPPVERDRRFCERSLSVMHGQPSA